MVTQKLVGHHLLSGSSVKTAVGSVLLSCTSFVNISSFIDTETRTCKLFRRAVACVAASQQQLTYIQTATLSVPTQYNFHTDSHNKMTIDSETGNWYKLLYKYRQRNVTPVI